MKRTQVCCWAVLGAGLLWTTLVGAAEPAGFLPAGAVTQGALETQVHPLAGQINQFLKDQRQTTGFQPTGLTRGDYLKVMASEVQALKGYQNAEGRIIDPVEHKEIQYATPCFAHAVAALAAAGHPVGQSLLESGMKAMDVATTDMTKGNKAIPQGHGDFYTYPVMKAFGLYQKVAPAERVEEWRKKLAAVEPKKLYSQTTGGGGNWNLVNTAGEFLRAKAGLTGMDYVEMCLEKQEKAFGELGMFDEKGNPLPYDHFPRHFLASLLEQGYRGKSAAFYEERLWRAAWVSLFMQSPFGEAPTGYRSSHHIWNEAQSAVTFEIYAKQYAQAGRPEEAGAFKRAAHLSLASIEQWLRPDGSGYIVKNRYPIEAKHGYEAYSSHTQYNLLMCSMLAGAWEFADEAIAERPAPADVGGFVMPILKPFHKVFASAGGSYVEYDTNGDHVYNPTGLLRIHLAGGHPQLGPSDGCAEKYSGKGVQLAVGPGWRDGQGAWHSLAEQSGEPAVEVLEQQPARAAFRVRYALAGDMRVTETITCDATGVTVVDEVVGPAAKAMRVSFPMLVTDGLKETEVTVQGGEIRLRLEGKGERVVLLEPAQGTWQRSGQKVGHRNGMAEAVFSTMEFAGGENGGKMVYRIEAAK